MGKRRRAEDSDALENKKPRRFLWFLAEQCPKNAPTLAVVHKVESEGGRVLVDVDSLDPAGCLDEIFEGDDPLVNVCSSPPFCATDLAMLVGAKKCAQFSAMMLPKNWLDNGVKERDMYWNKWVSQGRCVVVPTRAKTHPCFGGRYVWFVVCKSPTERRKLFPSKYWVSHND